MSVVIGGVTCEEIVKGYSESVDPSSGAVCTKSYLAPWATRYAVLRGMAGFTTVQTRNGSVTFNTPFTHPESPALYVKSAYIRPVGMPFQGTKQLAFPACIIDATFGVVEWGAVDVANDPTGNQAIDPDTKFLYATQEINYGAEYHTVPGSALRISTGNGWVPINRDTAIKVSHADMSITFHKLPYMPTNFLPYIDNVNKTTFLGCDKGKVRFSGGRTRRELQSDGSITQSVTMNFSYRPKYDWNMIPNPYVAVAGGGREWETIQYKNGVYPFPYNDLSGVFPQGYSY